MIHEKISAHFEVVGDPHHRYRSGENSYHFFRKVTPLDNEPRISFSEKVMVILEVLGPSAHLIGEVDGFLVHEQLFEREAHFAAGERE